MNSNFKTRAITLATSLAVTAKEGFVVGARSMPGNLKRRSAIEAHIGHMKSDGLLGPCHFKGAEGDAMHTLLCGAGHKLRLLLKRLRTFLRLLYDWIARALLFSFGMPGEA